MMFRIKEILTEKQMSSKQLAELLGVSPQYVSGLIREVDNPSVSMLKKIADALDVPVSSLFADYPSQPRVVDNSSVSLLKKIAATLDVPMSSLTAESARCPHCGKEIRIELK